MAHFYSFLVTRKQIVSDEPQQKPYIHVDTVAIQEKTKNVIR